MTTPLREMRSHIANVVRGVARVGQVYERQMHSTSWEEFGALFQWTDPDTESPWIRGWLVMPSEETAGTRDQTYGSEGVGVSITSRILIRGMQALNEKQSMYEDFHDTCYAVFLALASRRRYTLTSPGAEIILQPGVRWESYRNRRIGGAACHTAEMVVSYQYETTINLGG